MKQKLDNRVEIPACSRFKPAANQPVASFKAGETKK